MSKKNTIFAHTYPWGANGEHDDLTADETELAGDWFADWHAQQIDSGLPEMQFLVRSTTSQADIESSLFHIMVASDEPLSAESQHELRVLREAARLESLYYRAMEAEGSPASLIVGRDEDVAREASEMAWAGAPLIDIARA